jgi:hypothetical protein
MNHRAMATETAIVTLPAFLENALLHGDLGGLDDARRSTALSLTISRAMAGTWLSATMTAYRTNRATPSTFACTLVLTLTARSTTTFVIGLARLSTPPSIV